jgi:hypothetical protein
MSFLQAVHRPPLASPLREHVRPNVFLDLLRMHLSISFIPKNTKLLNDNDE